MKIKINIKSIFAIFFIVLGTASCTDWLSVEPEGKLLKDNYWKTTEDVNGALAAMYNSLQGSTVTNFIWGELRADLADMDETYSGYSDYNRIAESDITVSNGKISWSQYYKTINLANTLRFYNKEVYGSDVTFTKELMDQVDSEAMFVSALNHFYLVRLWQQVPIMDAATVSDTSDYVIPKSSEREVIDFITSELLEAKDMASDDITLKGRANKYSIMTLLADVYLWDEQYQLASDYCDSVMAAGYSLEPSVTWWNLYYPGNSVSESIFEIQYDEILYEEANPMYNGLLLPMLPDVDEYGELLTSDDSRTCNPFSPTVPYPAYKYLLADVSTVTERTTDQQDANFIYYRYADVLLIKAEALNELGGHEIEVNELLRETKERAGVVHSDISGLENLRTEILNERGREFSFEGKRWFDILRNAKRDHFSNRDLIADIILEGVNVQKKEILSAYVYDTLSYYLPIPERDIESNPELVQNPFYDK